MDKKQFINELVDALAGEVPSQVISENVNYYRNYFVEESAKSHRSEKEIIEELGSPRLIARSIIDAYQAEHGPYSGDSNEKHTTGNEDNQVSNHSSSGCGIAAFIVVMIAFLVVMTVMRVILSIPGLIILIILALVLAFYRSGRR